MRSAQHGFVSLMRNKSHGIMVRISCETYPAKQDVECVARIRELAVYACMRAVLELYDPLPI